MMAVFEAEEAGNTAVNLLKEETLDGQAFSKARICRLSIADRLESRNLDGRNSRLRTARADRWELVMQSYPKRRSSFAFTFVTVALIGWALLITVFSALADTNKSTVISYTLLHGSSLMDDCPICDRAIVAQPMRGKFEVRLVEQDSLFSTYAVENVSFTAGGAPGATYKVTGYGTYRFGGEVALLQEMSLALMIDDGTTNKLCYLTNSVSSIERRWPMLKIHLDQTNGTLTQLYRLDIAAAPLQEIWFSTKTGFHAGATGSSTAFVSGGDLISSSGRVVKRNNELTAGLGFMPAVPDMGLDAVDILPGGEIAFSMEQDGFSETLGALHHGDLLFARSARVIRNGDLLAPITGGKPLPYDLGLDAVQVEPDLQVYFSVRSNLVVARDPQPDLVIHSGDLLFSDLVLREGHVVKQNSELLARFHPAAPAQDVGLDAVYLWPSGEIWFSTELGFDDQQLGGIQAGDLLSDQGYIVWQNLELVSAFAPLEKITDFGLDALFVVTDVTPQAPAGYFTRVARGSVPGVIDLQWTSEGRVFRLERAEAVAGPYLPWSQIIPDEALTVSQTNSSAAFYRFRQW